MFTGVRKPISKNCVNVLKAALRRYSSTAVCETENVVYPPIQDLSREGKIKGNREAWYRKLEKLESVEEKLFGINMPRYYGYKSLNLKEGIIPHYSLDHTQHITRTYVMDNLPEFYDAIINTKQMDNLLQIIRPHIENAIQFEYCSRLREEKMADELEEDKKRIIQDEITNSTVYQINRIILTALASSMPHLLEAEVDFEPRVEAFWFAGGMERAKINKIRRQEKIWLRKYDRAPINLPIQYIGSPILQLRHLVPLKEIIPISESDNEDFVIPRYKMHPTTLGYNLDYRHATCIPGFWPGDPAEFGLLSYHKLASVYLDPVNPVKDALTVQAIFASYSWLLSQACYQGFSVGSDITYPLVSQAVLTNGQMWAFSAYQLNTIMLDFDYADENPKRNLCWVTKPEKLFDVVENGQIHGFNENVLRKLIAFYMNTPLERSGVNMKPYLGESVKHIADIADPERRTWLEENFKHITSNRPRHLKIPEIAHWQKIYLIEDKRKSTRKRTDPWQFGYEPAKRRMDDISRIYVPKCLRENPKKKRYCRWAKTYFPDA